MRPGANEREDRSRVGDVLKRLYVREARVPLEYCINQARAAEFHLNTGMIHIHVCFIHVPCVNRVMRARAREAALLFTRV